MLIHNKGNFTRHAAGVKVIPGANTLSEDEFVQFTSHPLMQKLIKSGEIVVPEGSLKTKSLAGLNADDAIELVKDTFSVEYLEKFKEGESRKTVLSAIEEQLKSLQPE